MSVTSCGLLAEIPLASASYPQSYLVAWQGRALGATTHESPAGLWGLAGPCRCACSGRVWGLIVLSFRNPTEHGRANSFSVQLQEG
jgi:hypothetical protein